MTNIPEREIGYIDIGNKGTPVFHNASTSELSHYEHMDMVEVAAEKAREGWELVSIVVNGYGDILSFWMQRQIGKGITYD